MSKRTTPACTNQFSTIQNKLPNFKKLRKLALELHDDILDGKIIFNYSNVALRATPADIVRTYSQSKKISNGLYRSLLINHIFNSEQRCTGSGFAFITHLSGFKTLQSCKRSTVGDVKRAIRTYLGPNLLSELVFDVLSKTGLEQKVKFSVSEVDSVKLKISQYSDVEAEIDHAFGTVNQQLDCACLLFVDGRVETVAEIDPLLQWASENSNPVIIIAASFSVDVSNTLKENHNNGNLKVFPYVMRSDRISDASREYSAPLVSTDTGNRFTNIEYSDLEQYTCHVDTQGLSLLIEKGNRFSVDVLVPFNKQHILGLIEERVKVGLLVAKSAAKFGTVTVMNNGKELCIPKNSVEFADRSMSSWNRMQSNIGCVIHTG